MTFAASVSGPPIPWSDVMPLVVLLGATCALLLFGSLIPAWSRRSSLVVNLVASSTAIVLSCIKWNDLYYEKGRTIIADALAVDRFAVMATIIICGALFLGSVLMHSHLERVDGQAPEMFALMITSAIGAIVMVASNDLIVLFLGLETLSLSLYLLAASNRHREQSQEAGLKYFVLGGFASAFLLYGIALVFGSTSSTSISGMAADLRGTVGVGHSDAMLLVGIGMLVIGLAFKVSAAPFHVWTPDVYEGAPTPVTAFMGSVGKLAAFAAMLRVLTVGLGARVDDWRPVVWGLAILTVFVGSTMAVVQTNVKRMLAYSSISHAGFILVGVEAAGHPRGDGLTSTMAYLAIYSVLVLGSFAVVSAVSGGDDAATSLDDFKGLAKRKPSLALAMSVLLFSQAGVPFTAGFIAKFGVIKSAVEVHSYAIAIAAMVAAVIGAYLYLRITVSMWLEAPASDSTVAIPAPVKVVIGLSVAFTLLIGLFPSMLLEAVKLVRFAPN